MACRSDRAQSAAVIRFIPAPRCRRIPGRASVTPGFRWTSDDGRDDLNLVADAINDGPWGYNNLQWFGGTYYHKFNDYWHVAFEAYNLHQNNVPNALNPAAAGIIAGGGTPFGPQHHAVQCAEPGAMQQSGGLTCTASAQSFLTYLNYSPNELDNFSLRLEWYDDMEGQRTGTKSRYVDLQGAGSTGSRRRSRCVRRSRTTVARRAGLQRQFQCRHRSQQELRGDRRCRPDRPLLRGVSG